MYKYFAFWHIFFYIYVYFYSLFIGNSMMLYVAHLVYIVKMCFNKKRLSYDIYKFIIEKCRYLHFPISNIHSNAIKIMLKSQYWYYW